MKQVEIKIGDKFFTFEVGKNKVKKIKRLFGKVTIIFEDGKKVTYFGYSFSTND